MSLFWNNGVQLKFFLVELSECEETEIRNMIVSNGGEISDTGDPPIINFTVPEKYIKGKVMFDVQFIRECVKSNTILDLHSYKLGERNGYDGCIMSLFLYGEPNCTNKSHHTFHNKAIQTSMSNIGSLSDSESNQVLVFHSSVTSQMELCLDAEPMSPKLTSTPCNRGGGDIADKQELQVSSADKRPCHVEYETEVVPKLIGLQKLCQNIDSMKCSSLRIIPHTSTEHVTNQKLSPQVATTLTSTTKSYIDLSDSDKSQVNGNGMDNNSVDGQERDGNEEERHKSPVNFGEKNSMKTGEKYLTCIPNDFKRISNKCKKIHLINLASDSDKNTSNGSNHSPSCDERGNSDYDSNSLITKAYDNKLARRIRFVKTGSSSSAVTKRTKRINKRYQEDDSNSDDSVRSIQCLSSASNNRLKRKHMREKIYHRDRDSRETENKKVNRERDNVILHNLMHRVKSRSRPVAFTTSDANESCEINDNTYSTGNKLRVKNCTYRNQISKHVPHWQANEYKDPLNKTDRTMSRVSKKRHKINDEDSRLNTFIDASNRGNRIKNQLNETDSNESACDDANMRKVRRRGQHLGKTSSRNYVANDLSCRSVKMIKRKLRRISEDDESETDPEGYFQHFRRKHSDIPLKRKKRNNITEPKNVSDENSDSSFNEEIISRRKYVLNSLNKKSSCCGRKLYHEKSKNNRIIDNDVSSEHEDFDSGSFNSTGKYQSKSNVSHNVEDSDESRDESLIVIPGPSRSVTDRGNPKSNRICSAKNLKSKNTIRFSDDELSQISDEKTLTKSNRAKVNPHMVVERGSRSCPRRNFASWERHQMIRYLIDKDAIESAKGLKIWKEMIQDGYLKHRTAMSLNNHFIKYILPQIECFAIPEKLIFKFKRLM